MARKRLTKKPAVSSSPYEEEEQPQNDTVETQQQQNSAVKTKEKTLMARKRHTKKPAVSSSPYEEEEQPQIDTVETQLQQNSAEKTKEKILMARKSHTKKPAVSSSPYEEEQPQIDTVETQQQQNSTGYEEEDDGLSSKSSKFARKRLTKNEKHEKRGLSSKSSKPLDSHNDSADTESNQPPSPSPSDFILKPISPQRKPRRELKLPKKKKDAEDRKPKRGTRSGTPHRIWSDEDEIGILKGMIVYHKGKNPLVGTVDLFGFVKESLQFNASSKQFFNKIRKLKKKYYTENGKDVIFSKPHDLECVELSNKLWGAGGMDVKSKSNSVIKSGTLGGGSRDIGGGVREIVLAIPKLSMKKGNKRGYELLNQEEKEENLKRQKKSLNEEAGGGDEDLSGEVKRKGVKKEKKKMILSDEVGEKGNENDEKNEKAKVVLNEEKGGEMQKPVVNVEINGEQEDSEDFWENYPHLRSSLQAENLPENVKETSMVMLAKIEKDKLLELEMERTSFKNAKLELLRKKKVLIWKQINLASGI